MIRFAKYVTTALFWAVLAQGAAVGRDLPVASIGGRDCYVYEVSKGENIYDVSREVGLPTVEITRYNPSAADGLRTGMKLYLPVTLVDKGKVKPAVAAGDGASVVNVDTGDAGLNVSEVSVPSTVVAPVAGVDAGDGSATTYTVKRGESLYGISRKFDITMEQLIAMNPSAEYGVKGGDVLIIKPGVNGVVTADVGTDTTTLGSDDVDYSLVRSEERITAQYVTPLFNDEAEELDVATDTLSMAVMLPFMLSDADASKNSSLFIEFYKGLLLAVDSLRVMPGNHINLYAYDTAASTDTIVAIMNRPEMRHMDVIIGPDNDAHLQLIAGLMSPETYLYNVFNVRSNLYATNSRVMQANIPHSSMLNKAVDAFSEMFATHTPVFVARIDGAADKDAFTSLLKQRLDKDSIAYRDVTFRNLLSHRDLDMLSRDLDYVFVPVSGARAEFAKISEAIRRFGESRPDRSTKVFGYPDWIIFRGEYLTRLRELEATIYTRFYADMTDYETMQIVEKFKQKYGSEMLDAAPVQGLLGFDTGKYLIELLKIYGREFGTNAGSYSGVQSVMNYVGRDTDGADGGGAYNDALIIVTFAPDSTVLKTIVE